jgi:hypothetical protein
MKMKKRLLKILLVEYVLELKKKGYAEEQISIYKTFVKLI